MEIKSEISENFIDVDKSKYKGFKKTEFLITLNPNKSAKYDFTGKYEVVKTLLKKCCTHLYGSDRIKKIVKCKCKKCKTESKCEITSENVKKIWAKTEFELGSKLGFYHAHTSVVIHNKHMVHIDTDYIRRIANAYFKYVIPDGSSVYVNVKFVPTAGNYVSHDVKYTPI